MSKDFESDSYDELEEDSFDTNENQEDDSGGRPSLNNINSLLKNSGKTARQTMSDKAKQYIKQSVQKAVLSAGKAAVSAIGNAIGAVLAWASPVLVPVVIVVVCIYIVLVPTSYSFIQYIGAYEDFNDGVLKVSTSVKTMFNEWFSDDESKKSLDKKAENYQAFLIDRFSYINNQLIEKNVKGTDAADMKDLAVSWIYGKIYSDFFKPSLKDNLFTLLDGEDHESTVPVLLNSVEETATTLYTPVLGSNVEDARKEYFGDSINLYDIEAFDYVAGSLFDLLDLDLDVALSELKEEYKEEIEKEKKEKHLAIYQKYSGQLLNTLGENLYNALYEAVPPVSSTDITATDDKFYRSSKATLDILNLDSEDLLKKKKDSTHANYFYSFLMEAQSYSSSTDLSKVREKLAKLKSDGILNTYSNTEELGKAFVSKQSDYTNLVKIYGELDNMYVNYLCSFAKTDSDIEKIKSATESLFVDYSLDKCIELVKNNVKKETSDATVEVVKKYTLEDLNNKVADLVKELDLSRTQQAAITYRNYLVELETVTTIEYYSINLNSELFKNISNVYDYTSAGAKEYIKNKSLGLNSGFVSLFDGSIASLSDINNNMFVDSSKNPVVSALDTTSGSDYFNGNINKVISAVNIKLNSSFTSLENIRTYYNSTLRTISSEIKILKETPTTEENKDTVEKQIKELEAEMSDIKKVLTTIDNELKYISDLQIQLLGLESITPTTGGDLLIHSNLSSYYKPGQNLNFAASNSLEAGEYSDGEYSLYVKKYKNTQEEAIKKTIQKHYKDVLKTYKTNNSSGNKGNVDLTMDISEFMGGLTLADYQTEYFEKMIPLAMSDYYESGIFPSVTIAQGIIESSWGGLSPYKYDYLANEANNLFGIKAYYWNGPVYTLNANGNPEKPGYRQYDSWAECVADHGKFLTVGTYLQNGILEATDCWGQIDALVAGGYCENGDYTDMLTTLINDYGLQLVDVKVGAMSSFTATDSSEDSFSYHKDGALVLWREYYTNNLTFQKLDEWVSKLPTLNQTQVGSTIDKKPFSTHIINAIDDIDSTLKSELLSVGITAGELKNLVAATLNAGLYTPKEKDNFTIQPGFKVVNPTNTNAKAIVKAIAKEYIDIYKQLGSKDKGFAIYMYVSEDRDLTYMEIKDETVTFSEFVNNTLTNESESYTDINPNFVKVAQIISGDVDVDVSDFYKIKDATDNTSGGSSSSTISNPVDMFYQDWLESKYIMHDMYNTMIEETNAENAKEGGNGVVYELLPSYDEVLGSMNEANKESDLEGVLTIEGPNGEYYAFDIRKDFITENIDETQTISDVQYIVIHDSEKTSPFATASTIVRKMKQKGAVETMHYVVGSNEVIHTVKDNVVANHINDSATASGGTRPEILNSNSLGVQFTVNSTADKDKTFWYTVALTKYLMEKNSITDYNNIVLHNDVTGVEDSKRMLANNREEWNKFMDSLKNSTIKFTANTSGVAGEAALSIVKLALEYKGHPYVWGANGQIVTDSSIASLRATFPDNSSSYDLVDKKFYNSNYRGFDCSGFVQYVYKNNSTQSIDVGRSTYDQVKKGTDVFEKGATIDTSKLLPGDLLFFGDWDSPNHVGIWIGNGNYIHSPKSGDVVKITSGVNNVVRVKRIIEASSTGKFEFYSQHDPRWASKIYYSSSNISKAGCGPTSTAMVLSGLNCNISSLDLNKDGKLTPDEMVDFSRKKGTYVVGAGTSFSFYPAVAEAVGVNLKESTSLEEAKAALRQGKAIVASYDAGHWTSGGHLIALVGISSDGKIIVHDPNMNSYTDTRYGRYNGPNPDSNIVGPGTGFKKFFIFG